jgi:hypothetical protein
MEKMNMKKLIMTLVILSTVNTSMAQWLWWTNDAGNRQWTDSGNWTAYPTASDDVVIGTDFGTGPILSTGQTGSGFWIHLTETTPAGALLTVDGGTLNCADHLLVGENWGATQKGTLQVNSGIVNTVLLMAGGGTNGSSGTGYVDINGGTVNISWLLAIGGGYSGTSGGGVGHVQLDGGILNVLGGGGIVMSNQGSLDVTGGTLVMAGQITDITGLGNVTAYGGDGSFVYDYNGTTTAITAIPEPASLFLIGLGMMIFRKTGSR